MQYAEPQRASWIFFRIDYARGAKVRPHILLLSQHFGFPALARETRCGKWECGTHGKSRREPTFLTCFTRKDSGRHRENLFGLTSWISSSGAPQRFVANMVIHVGGCSLQFSLPEPRSLGRCPALLLAAKENVFLKSFTCKRYSQLCRVKAHRITGTFWNVCMVWLRYHTVS